MKIIVKNGSLVFANNNTQTYTFNTLDGVGYFSTNGITDSSIGSLLNISKPDADGYVAQVIPISLGDIITLTGFTTSGAVANAVIVDKDFVVRQYVSYGSSKVTPIEITSSTTGFIFLSASESNNPTVIIKTADTTGWTASTIYQSYKDTELSGYHMPTASGAALMASSDCHINGFNITVGQTIKYISRNNGGTSTTIGRTTDDPITSATTFTVVDQLTGGGAGAHCDVRTYTATMTEKLYSSDYAFFVGYFI